MLSIFLNFLNDNKDILGWLFGSGIFFAFTSGVYRFAVWVIKTRRSRKTRTNDNFPFKVIYPNSNVAKEILGGLDDDPLTDRNIPYQQRSTDRNVRREIEDFLTTARYVLVTGKTGLGKTREAVHVAESLNKEGWTILYLTREQWLSAPSKLPKGIPERKLLFLLDDLNRKIFASRVEQSPKADEVLQPLTIPLQERLSETLETFETLCSKGEVRVIATARDEKNSEFENEPSEWDKLEFNKYYKWWKKFRIYQLIEPEDTAEINLLEEISQKAKIDVNQPDFENVARRNDGTFSNLVENLRTASNLNRKFQLDNFRDSLRGTWEKRYKDAIVKHESAKYIYDAIDLAQETKLSLSFWNVYTIAKIIATRNQENFFYKTWSIYFSLSYLSKKENILRPRDGQIESKGYRINSKEFLPYIYRIIWKQRHWESLTKELFFDTYIRLLPPKVIPKLLTQSSLSILERFAVAILDVDSINAVGTAYDDLGFRAEATLLYEKSIELLGPHLHRFVGKYKQGEFIWFNLGINYIYIDEYEKAKNAFEKSNFRNAIYWFYIGICHQNLNNPEKAIEAQQKSIELDPKNPSPWNGLGNVKRDQKQPQEAIAAYQRAIELNSNYATPWHNLGNVFYELGQESEAISAFKKVIELNPKKAHPWKIIGDIYSKLDRTEEAIDSFKKAIELDHKYAGPWNGLGIVYQNLEQYDDAITALKKAIELDPKWAYPWHSLGNIYGELSRHDEAIGSFQKAIDLDSKYASPWIGLGIIYRKQKRYDDGITALKKAIELDPKWAYSWHILGNIYSELSRDDEAIGSFQKAINLDSKFPSPWNGLGIVYRKQKRYEDGITALKKAIELDPNWAYLWYQLGNIYLELNSYDNAISALQTAVELDPNFTDSWINLSNAYRGLKRYQEAVASLKKAVELDPKQAFPWHQLGILFELQKNLAEAFIAYQKAVEIEPETGMMRSSLISILKKLDKDIDAQKEIDTAGSLMEKENEYNRACFESICGNIDKALMHLKTALDKKETSLAWIHQDPDFDFIRDNPHFTQLIENYL